MSKTLTVSYELKPPADTMRPVSHPASNTHDFPVASGSSQQEYYKNLREAVLEAKAKVGEDLTVWKDAVGHLESLKEPKRGQEGDDDEDDDEEDSDEQI